MFEALKFRVQVHRLQRQRRKIQKSFHDDLEKAKKGGDKELQQELIAEWFSESDAIEDKIAILQNRHVQDLANRHLVPIPSFDSKTKDWTESKLRPGSYYLSPGTMLELRSHIHEERKRRREGWMPWVAMTIGLMGGATGLIAALTAWFKG